MTKGLPFTGGSKILIAVILSVAIIAVILTKLDLSEIWRSLVNTNLWFILVAVLALFLNLVSRGYRWSALLAPVGRFSPIRECYPLYSIAFAANIIIPFRAGDFIRVILFCSRHRQVAKASVLATIVLEHLVDFLTVVGLIFVVIAIADVPPEIATITDTIGIMGVIMLIGFWLLVQKPAFARRMMQFSQFLPGFLANPLNHIFETTIEIFSGFRSPITAFAISFWSFVQWFSGWMMTAAFVAAVQLDLPWHVVLLVLAVGTLGAMIPITPGNIGVVHALYVLVLVYFDVDINTAFTFALLMHGIPLVIIVLNGLVATYLRHLPFKVLATPENDPGAP
mgnify:CR=1 FL=1